MLELASGATMGKKDGSKKYAARERANKENAKNSSPGEVQDEEANASTTISANLADSANIAKVLEEIRDFHKELQLNDIKSELTNLNQAEVETPIEKTEDHVQNVEQVLNKMIKMINQQENKLLGNRQATGPRNFARQCCKYEESHGGYGSAECRLCRAFLPALCAWGPAFPAQCDRHPGQREEDCRPFQALPTGLLSP